MAEHFLRLVAEGYTFDFDKRTAKTPVLGETMNLTVFSARTLPGLAFPCVSGMTLKGYTATRFICRMNR